MNKQVATTRINKHVGSGEKMEFAINSFEIFASCEDNYELSTWHNGNHVETKEFNTIEELATAMKAESGDLRVWKVVRYEG